MHWYALQVRTNWERRVAAALESRQAEYYLPLIRTWRQWSDRTKRIDQPAFPGYLFIRSTAAALSGLHVAGLIGVLGTDGPEAIPEEQIECVRRVLAATVAGEITPLYALPKIGATVEVIYGPLYGMIGTCERLDKRCRVAVSVPLLHRSLAVTFGLDEIRVLDKPSWNMAA